MPNYNENNSHNEKEEEKPKAKRGIEKRIHAICIIMALLLVVDLIRVFDIQIVNGEKYSEKAQSQQLSDKELEAVRGTIYDSDGNVLAQSATVWTVYLDPKNIEKETTRTLIVDTLANYLKLDDKEKSEVEQKSRENNHYTVVAEEIENDIKEKISKFISDKGLSTCIGFEQESKRYYPYGTIASPVIGFTGDENKGLYGIEYGYNDLLAGTNGRIISAKDAVSNQIEDGYSTSIAAKDGDNVYLTINQTIQYYLEQNLKKTLEQYQCKGAYGVVMDCNTGAVLGMSSLPDYDCNDPYKLTYDKNKNAIKNAPKSEKAQMESAAIENQWNNFTVGGTYVPGSVFKTFIASAALEEGVVDLNTTYTCTGKIQVEDYTMNCHYHAGHGTQTLTQGLENSCNPFFITIGQRLGVHNYFKYFEAFGFTQKTGIDLPGEASPQFYKEKQYSIVELSSAAFGQTNSLTPIQVCTGLCAIANGGTLLKPYIVSKVVDPDGKTVQKNSRTEVRQVISSETSKTVCKMMKAVVDEGTGKNGYVAGYSVGGKTGTSTKLGEFAKGEADKYIVSFAAIAPSDDPQIAMIIIIDEPNEDLGGGALCAPIAATVIEETMAELNIEPKYSDSESESLSTYTPNVIGKSVDAAKEEIEQQKFKYKIVGKGKKVIRQVPTTNVKIPSGGTVILYTDNTEKKTVTVPSFSKLTVSEAKTIAKSSNLNIEVSGNDLSSSTVVGYSQDVDAGKTVEEGTVISVTFKNSVGELD